MPMVFAAVASVVTAVSAAVETATFAVLTTVGVSGATALGAAHFAGVAIASLGFANGAWAGVQAWSAVSLLTSVAMPKKTSSGGLVGETAGSPSPVAFKADPNAAISCGLGRTGLAGNIVFAQTDGTKNRFLDYLLVDSLGPIDSYESFIANGTTVPFSGNTATGTFAGKMYMDWRLGARPDTALNLASLVAGASLPDWTTAHKLSGLACRQWMLDYDPNIYPTGTPSGPLVVGKWLKVYDPRLDSTYPGGSGSQRANDDTTWTWSANPGLHALTFCIGRFWNGIKITGLGAAMRLIDVPAFVEVANVADANSWTLGGSYLTTDPKANVLAAMLAAASAVFVPLGAQISCMVDTPRVSIATIDQSDVTGQASVSATQSRRSRINRVSPKYRSEDHGWQYVAAGPVAVPAYVTADGGFTRTRAIQWDLVQSAHQVAQLAAYIIVNGREFGPVNLPVKPKHLGLRIGDAVDCDIPELGLNTQQCIVTGRSFDPASLVVGLTLRSETAAKHAFALGQSASPPPTPSLTSIDLTQVAAPGISAWAAVGGTATGNTGGLPVINITGASDNPNAELIVFEFAAHGSGAWRQWTTAKNTATGTVMTGLAPGQAYDVAVSYVVRGVHGARRVLGPVGAGGVIAPTSGAVLTGHIGAGEVQNTNIGNGEVDTAKVAINAITDGVSADDPSTQTITASYQTVCAMAYTTRGGRPELTCDVTWTNTTGSTAGFGFQVLKDGVSIKGSAITGPGHFPGGHTFVARDPSPDTSSHLWEVQMLDVQNVGADKVDASIGMEEKLR